MAFDQVNTSLKTFPLKTRSNCTQACALDLKKKFRELQTLGYVRWVACKQLKLFSALSCKLLREKCRQNAESKRFFLPSREATRPYRSDKRKTVKIKALKCRLRNVTNPQKMCVVGHNVLAIQCLPLTLQCQAKQRLREPFCDNGWRQQTVQRFHSWGENSSPVLSALFVHGMVPALEELQATIAAPSFQGDLVLLNRFLYQRSQSGH